MVTGDRLVRGRSLEWVVGEAIDGGADVIQYRDKEATPAAMLEQAARLLALCRDRGVPLIVNDRVDVCLTIGADGLHVGQTDLPAGAARRLLGAERILGVSVASAEQVEPAVRAGADYLGAGPVFEARATKPDADPPMGLDGLRRIVACARIPVMAIGGIDRHNARRVLDAGAQALAVVSAVMAADDPRAAARSLYRLPPRPPRS